MKDLFLIQFKKFNSKIIIKKFNVINLNLSVH